jgi:predicted small lipoprotein YifL
MMRRLTAFCALITLLLTLGCGTKGPLYLPPADSAAQQDAGEASEP